MAQRPAVGVRLPQEFLDKIDEICEATGKSRTDILLEAVASYLGENPPESLQSELEQLRLRVESLEKKLLVA